MSRFIAFPSYRYHRDEPGGRIFQSQAEVTVAGEGWVDSPAKIPILYPREHPWPADSTECQCRGPEQLTEVGVEQIDLDSLTSKELRDEIIESIDKPAVLEPEPEPDRRTHLEGLPKSDLISLAVGLGITGNWKTTRPSTLVNKILTAEAEEG